LPLLPITSLTRIRHQKHGRRLTR